ncbi:MarR family winged helix-turn-helix transcriptional regulator [Nocardioides sp.]|uniref:MarR family winged helix-turn-helix transcriptional regulator n=1 Tax=Nocardioides sp. TaxID=35761 RepID=UPI003515DF63
MTTRWLNADEERAWRGFHRLRGDLTARLNAELAADSGLTEADFAVLVYLSEAPGGVMRARELQRELAWDRSRLSHQLTRMERRGTVERRACATDARGLDISITAAGRAAITAAAPAHVAVVRHCFVNLLTPEQLATLADIADIVADHLEEAHGRRATGDE